MDRILQTNFNYETLEPSDDGKNKRKNQPPVTNKQMPFQT